MIFLRKVDHFLRIVTDFKVGLCEILADPYLNIDAGTMSPIEHGEVYVLDDGGEVLYTFTKLLCFFLKEMSLKN